MDKRKSPPPVFGDKFLLTKQIITDRLTIAKTNTKLSANQHKQYFAPQLLTLNH